MARELICTDCGNEAHCYDHRDYSKPLEIVPVCAGCNRRRGPAKPVIYGSASALDGVFSMQRSLAAQDAMNDFFFWFQNSKTAPQLIPDVNKKRIVKLMRQQPRQLAFVGRLFTTGGETGFRLSGSARFGS